MQVAEAMNSNQLAPPDLPYRLLHALLQAAPTLAALRSIIAGAASPSPGKPALDCVSCHSAAVKQYLWQCPHAASLSTTAALVFMLSPYRNTHQVLH